MTLPFNEKIINDGEINSENFRTCNFIGYLNPKGKAIECSNSLGIGGHDANFNTGLFKKWFYLRKKYDETDEKINKLLGKKELNYIEKEKIDAERKREKLKQEVQSYYKDNQITIRCGLSINPYNQLKQDILEFFLNCYSNDSFVNGFGKDCSVLSGNAFENKVYGTIVAKVKRIYPRREGENYIDYANRVPKFFDFNVSYDRYKTELILDIFKDVMVQYLGYHYVARTPRTIFTSNLKIYETFYNYLLNDFTIFQIPKMNFDSREKRYVQQNPNPFLLPDSELRLKDEIQSIKKLVPLSERSRYYR